MHRGGNMRHNHGRAALCVARLGKALSNPGVRERRREWDDARDMAGGKQQLLEPNLPWPRPAVVTAILLWPPRRLLLWKTDSSPLVYGSLQIEPESINAHNHYPHLQTHSTCTTLRCHYPHRRTHASELHRLQGVHLQVTI